MKLHKHTFWTWPSTPRNSLYPWWRILFNTPLGVIAYALALLIFLISIPFVLCIGAIHGPAQAGTMWRKLISVLLDSV